MNKFQIEKRLSEIEEEQSRGNLPVRIIDDKSDAELCQIIGIENPTDEELQKIAQHGAKVVIIDDIS